MKIKLLVLFIPLVLMLMGCPQELDSEKDFDPISDINVDIGYVEKNNDGSGFFILIPENTSKISMRFLVTGEGVNITEVTNKTTFNTETYRHEVDYQFPFVELQFKASNESGDEKNYFIVIQAVTPE